MLSFVVSTYSTAMRKERLLRTKGQRGFLGKTESELSLEEKRLWKREELWEQHEQMLGWEMTRFM